MNFSEAMFYENYLTSNTVIAIQTLLLPTRQNDVENRDKAYLMPRLGSRAVCGHTRDRI